MKLFNGYVKDSKDALKIVEASVTGKFDLITQRLTQQERESIKVGDCYVWEQSLKMQRWTDGMRWSTSRYYKNFFTYYQISSDKREEMILMKRTFSIHTRDNRRFQLVNYLYKNKSLNKLLSTPSQSNLNTIKIPLHYYIKKIRHLQITCNTSNIDNYSKHDTFDKNHNSLSKSNITSSPNIHSFAPSLISATYCEFPSFNDPLLPLNRCAEDQRQLGLLKVSL